MIPSAQAGAWIRSNPNRVLAIGVAVLVMGISLWIGFKTRAASAALVASRGTWEQASNQLATVQQQFRLPTATESAALLAESSRMGALSVPASEKLNLIESVGRLAEAAALRSVRVSAIALPDSTFLPERSLAGSRIRPADYALAVEFGGSFSGALKFVSSLPLSVSLSRLNAGQHGGVAAYSVILSVYEHDADPGN
jgi:hypothetical protein